VKKFEQKGHPRKIKPSKQNFFSKWKNHYFSEIWNFGGYPPSTMGKIDWGHFGISFSKMP
jgi:hypothetical protein